MFWFPTTLIAQKIVVTESTERIGSGSNNALVVTIYEAETDIVLKRWKSLMKKYDGKVTMSSEVFADDAVIKSISDNPIDIYAVADKVKKDEVQLKVAFNLGTDYLSSSKYGTQFREARSIIYDFAYKLSKEMTKERLNEEKKAFSKLQSEQKSLVKQNNQLHESIITNREKIKAAEEAIKLAESNIVKNLDDQEKKKVEIERQRKVVDEVTVKERAIN
jgi:hypothetical protein